jgi:uncharacterized protein
MRLFFATDLHGSTLCFRKFCAALAFYECDVLILGGDLTGKMLVPVHMSPAGGSYELGGARRKFNADHFTSELERIANIGYYPIVSENGLDSVDGASYEDVLVGEALRRAEEWVAYAEKKLSALEYPILVAPGNDDHPALDDVFRSSSLFALGENEVLSFGDYEIASTGFSNETPWRTHRELAEEELESYFRPVLTKLTDPSRAILNIHVPPYGTALDVCPDIDEDLRVKTIAGNPTVGHHGSTAVRSLIEEYQPLASLHGHIHESRGFERMGRTLSLNPGSEYSDGILLGVVLEIGRKGRLKYSLTAG